MANYIENFSVGSIVRIVDVGRLWEFEQKWKFHHKLKHEQLGHAGQVAEIEKVSFYHGGDVLYELKGIPGIWHEQCLEADNPTTSGT